MQEIEGLWVGSPSPPMSPSRQPRQSSVGLGLGSGTSSTVVAALPQPGTPHKGETTAGRRGPRREGGARAPRQHHEAAPGDAARTPPAGSVVGERSGSPRQALFPAAPLLHSAGLLPAFLEPSGVRAVLRALPGTPGLAPPPAAQQGSGHLAVLQLAQHAEWPRSAVGLCLQALRGLQAGLQVPC